MSVAVLVCGTYKTYTLDLHISHSSDIPCGTLKEPDLEHTRRILVQLLV